MKPDASLGSKMAESLGVTTNTTNTLTPTTMRSITEIFESDECLQSLRSLNEGGFVPPPVSQSAPQQQQQQFIVVSGGEQTKATKTFVNLNSKNWHGGTTTVLTPSKCIPHIGVLIQDANVEEELEAGLKDTGTDIMKVATTRRSARANAGNRRHSSASTSSSITASDSRKKTTKGKRSTAGRKAANSKSDDDLSPEEEKRVKVRRQRNKEAAARCRKRRVDLTNTLLGEVENHEAKRRALEEEIKALKDQKEELEFILQAHSHSCNLSNGFSGGNHSNVNANLVVAVKSEPVIVEAVDNEEYVIPTTIAFESVEVAPPPPTPKRPVSLVIPSKQTVEGIRDAESAAGVAIETPSTVVTSLGFESLMTPCSGANPLSTPHFTTVAFTPTLNTPVNCSSQQRSSMTISSPTTGSDYVSL